MDIQELVSKNIAANLSTLGAEPVTIKSQTIKAVWGETVKEREIMGGSRVQRDVTIQFPTIQGFTLREGMTVAGRNQKWKVDRIQAGKAMTTLVLIEPNRIEATL
jgi:hypothetical protein